MRLILAAMVFTTLAAVGPGCGADSAPCSAWVYGGCCGLGNQAQFVRTCINPDGSERTETRCSGTCD